MAKEEMNKTTGLKKSGVVSEATLNNICQNCFIKNSTLNTPPSKLKRAFTLAEVLITLGIIGVVAALTMPTLINNHQVTSWESALKKSYSTITNGFHAIAAESGGDLRDSGLFDDIDDATFSDRMEKAIREHFNVVKICKIGDTTNCPSELTEHLLGFDNTSSVSYFFDNKFIAYTADGMKFAFKNEKCTKMQFSNESKLKHKCATVYVDINSEKGPNTRGKDIFQLGKLDENGDLYPDTGLEWAKARYGAANILNNDSQYWKNAPFQCGTPNRKTKDETVDLIYGQNCTARIMENGWKMDYLR